MKPSELIAAVTEALNTLAPVLDEIAALVENGSISPAAGQLKAVVALNDHLGKIGDGHIINALVQNLPAIINLIGMFFGPGGFHFPVPTPAPTPAPAPAPKPAP